MDAVGWVAGRASGL